MKKQASSMAERVRAACLEAATRAYEDAGLSGLCAEGRWEAAVDAIRRLDLGHVELTHDGASVGPRRP